MNLFEESSKYYGLAVFSDSKKRAAWISDTHPNGWTFSADALFSYPSGARVRAIVGNTMQDFYPIAGIEFQKILFVGEIDRDAKAYILSRLRSVLTGMKLEVEFI